MRLRPQFSLRLLLLFVTALCIALGVRGGPAERQRRAVKAIQAAGGRINYSKNSPVEVIYIYSDDGDAMLAYLEELTDLEGLIFNHANVTDAGLAHLRGLTGLKRLSLRYTRVTDAGLIHLETLANLERLSLEGTKVTYKGVARLQKVLPNCDILWPM